MKQLLLLRHTKSSWENSTLADKERPLNKRGTRDAARIGRYLRQVSYLPGMIYCSTAKRTRQTLSVLSSDWQYEPQISFEDSLYSESAINYLDVIEQASSSQERVMIIGHNPNMEQLACMLLSRDDQGFIRFPTGGLMCVEFAPNGWQSIRQYRGQLKWMIIPKVLKKLSI